MAETFVQDNLFSGDHEITTDSEILILGQNLKRGAVLGKITASGKVTLLDKSATDGSQEPHCVLAEDTDATTSDKKVPIYLTGQFDPTVLSVASGTTVAEMKTAMRKVCLFQKDSFDRS